MKLSFGLVVVILFIALVGPVGARQATPVATESLLAGMGYPELHIVAGNDGVDMPDQVNAGRTLIVYENVGDESLHPFMLRLPNDVAVDQAVADLGPEAMEPPDWFFDADFPGFVGETMPGQTSYAVVNLVVGVHLVLHDSAAIIDVVSTDATPEVVQAPMTDGTVSLFEMGFEFPESMEPGRQVWEVTNDGAVPHELLLVRSPVPVTAEQALELIEQEDQIATPVGGGPSPADITAAGGVGWLSPGMSAWTEVDLQPGHYIALCFVFDPETGMPHAMLGMVDVFVVDDEGTPTN